MNELNLAQIEKLTEIGKDFGCEFCFPPFKDNNNTFFHIDDKLAGDPEKYTQFIANVDLLEVGHKLYEIDGKMYLEVVGRE